MAIDYESDMTNETLIENFVSGSAIIDCALWLADEACPRSGSVRIRHERESSGNRQGWIENECNAKGRL
jgi:hypothetical protein